ncbi:fatty acid/phospholipid synthesis protein PlsX [Anaeromyxobacter dehalogenans 2CP-1]|uniref:Phosphate acyltransferase n=1 Tax=Anaeromyxobacter dehalogenans (strain ATCC BAA-258 / DSM 21875 / 2CP-1) TaxID=455488 RepID=PLSX_ANAD2|nr:phosphate acyltransferase PlsX [Anaeromyxobacter dehalogenans]B8JEX6.1 RecName: Full=Phosphate acyltransferase; AltName: Full=Acyl-ACP phosphotransacylase; AltName: Full=Acyl-[acyl-carrier-protein]--phosphate acyltransferase; AltName: Full=Phosphate-acyl-ACP acyltransferase [Anaeromyxobacter dehalogenans 2CP-1]ACL66272.1 fatty acid/phospholipid synthesis protein PlsX [Anaeromyxobacter dehalogenans 2CP-1]
MVGKIAPIAVDAMGGDHAPGAIVQGAVNAARKGLPVVLVGPEARVREELARHRAASSLPLEVHPATEVVEMHDHPGQAMRRKKDNSIRVCFDLVASGRAAGMVSAGNSGAVMAGAILVLGRPEGVERPAIVSVLPALKGAPLMLDMGAVVDCRPIHLVQFALMGEVYSRRVHGVTRPRVAILSNGEEDTKGTDLTRAAAAALRRAPIDFVGYCEGRDLLTGEVDVIVTDGFTGNVALKTMEGTAKVVGEYLKRALRSTTVSKIGGLLSRAALEGMKKRIDWREVGGAPLVGVNGVGFISHGRSDALAIENAIRRAGDAARTHFIDEIARAVAPSHALLEVPADGAATEQGPTPRRIAPPRT